MFFITPSINGPATSVANRDIIKDKRLVSLTAVTGKLYGGAEKIWENVMEIPTSHEMQVVKRIVAQRTAGDPSREIFFVQFFLEIEHNLEPFLKTSRLSLVKGNVK